MEKFFINGSTSLKLRGARTCSNCGQYFPSGKAFGEHWRHHLQQNRRRGTGGNFKVKTHGQRDSERKEKKNMMTTVIDDDHDHCNQSICYVSDKSFYSMRSLSRCMRFHPKRFWKGIEPPEGMTSSFSTYMMSEGAWNNDDWTDTAISTVDLLKHLPRSWSRTGKRGRRSAAVAAAANGLLSLSRRECRKPEKRIVGLSPVAPFAKKRKVKTISGKGTLWRISTTYDNQEEEDIMDLKGNKVISTNYYSSEKKREKMYLGENKRKVVTSSSSSTETDETVSLLGSAAKTHYKKIDVTTNRYKCSSCDRSFPTFQGLGGHRSTHTKKISTPSMAKKKNTSNVASNSTPSSPTQLADSSPGTASSASNIVHGGQSGRVLLDFDLNELPIGMP